MELLQENSINIFLGLLVGWMLWKRFIAPKISGVKSMSASDYKQLVSKPHTLVDVRQQAEWISGHAKSAVHIPLGEISTRMQELPDDKPLVVICASGNRSAMAATKLAKSGFDTVYNFSGGMGAWQGAGLPVKSGR